MISQTPGQSAGLAAAPRAGVKALLALPQLPLAEAITVHPGDCSAATPAQFSLGQTVCVKVTGPLGLRPTQILRNISIVNPSGYALSKTGLTLSPQEITFILPSTATSVVGGETVDNRGEWQVISRATAFGAVKATTSFIVRDTAQPVASLAVTKAVIGSAEVAAGSNVSFNVFVGNFGPDDAQNVSITDEVPANTTFVSANAAGTDFTCATAGSPTTTTCTAASLASGTRARITLTYTVDSGAPAKTLIVTRADVATTTAQRSTRDNSSSATIIVTDNAAGGTSCTLTCPADMTVTANTTQGGQPGALVNHSAAGVLGDCGAVTNSPQSGSFLAVGTHTITSTSETGPSCTFTVTVLGTPAPTIACPADITVTDADNSGSETVNPGAPTFTASGGGTVTGVRSDGTPAVVDDDGNVVTPASARPLTDPYPAGVTSILWTVTDASGRTASCTQKIMVNSGACATDDEDPTITAPPDVTVGTGAGNTGCGVALDGELGRAEVSDNCSVNVTVTGIPAGNLFVPGTPYTLTYTATDGAGNTASDTQIVTVVDDTPPIIEAPADATYTCPSEVPVADPSQATRGEVLDAQGNPLPPGPPFENCGTPVVTVVDTDNGGAGSATNPLVITRTYTATDAAGNSASDSQTITVADGTAPTVTAPDDAAYQCASEVPAADASQATASDNCAAPNVTVADVSNGGAGSPASPLVITRTYTATDAAGNTASDSQTITVIDTTAPVIALNDPTPQVVECHTSYTERGATASDNCSASFAATPSGSVNVEVPGTYTITYNAADAAGNAATPVTRTVTVVDTTAPVISCPADIVVSLPLNSPAVSMPVSFAAPTATDSCDASVPTTTSQASGSVFNVGTTTVTATATDDSGNSSSCSFSVTVLYNFTGFFSPINNGALNQANAGRTIPIKFSLSGNKGLNIFAAGYPASHQVACGSETVNDVQETTTTSNSSLTYSPDQYHYNWKTEGAWAGTCRELVVKLDDGSTHTARFKFK